MKRLIHSGGVSLQQTKECNFFPKNQGYYLNKHLSYRKIIAFRLLILDNIGQ